MEHTATTSLLKLVCCSKGSTYSKFLKRGVLNYFPCFWNRDDNVARDWCFLLRRNLEIMRMLERMCRSYLLGFFTCDCILAYCCELQSWRAPVTVRHTLLFRLLVPCVSCPVLKRCVFPPTVHRANSVSVIALVCKLGKENQFIWSNSVMIIAFQ